MKMNRNRALAEMRVYKAPISQWHKPAGAAMAGIVRRFCCAAGFFAKKGQKTRFPASDRVI
jgi:hypothetical protein